MHAFHLDAPEREVAAAAAVLPADELARADRLVTARLRNRFVMSHAIQRRILSEYLEDDAHRLAFDYGPHGKPSLRPPDRDAPRAPDIEFNLTHTEGLALLAVARGFPAVGVDVEHSQRLVDREPLARRCFAGKEYEHFAGLAESDRTHGFFLGWTRKESFMKATGEGLARPLDSFEVELRPNAHPCFLRLPPPERPDEWTLVNLLPAPRYVGALAVRSAGSAVDLRTWSWSPRDG